MRRASVIRQQHGWHTGSHGCPQERGQLPSCAAAPGTMHLRPHSPSQRSRSGRRARWWRGSARSRGRWQRAPAGRGSSSTRPGVSGKMDLAWAPAQAPPALPAAGQQTGLCQPNLSLPLHTHSPHSPLPRTLALMPAASACLAMEAARIMSSYEELVQEPMRPAAGRGGASGDAVRGAVGSPAVLQDSRSRGPTLAKPPGHTRAASPTPPAPAPQLPPTPAHRTPPGASPRGARSPPAWTAGWRGRG